MAVTTDNINKPILPRGADVRPIDSYNRAALYSGKALDFDGVNDDITISNSDSINITGNALTIAGYINTDGSSAWQGICYKDASNTKGFQLFVDKTGDLANVAIWNRALHPDEINAIMWKSYGDLNAVDKNGLQAWYALDDINGTTVPDSTGNHNGTSFFLILLLTLLSALAIKSFSLIFGS